MARVLVRYLRQHRVHNPGERASLEEGEAKRLAGLDRPAVKILGPVKAPAHTMQAAGEPAPKPTRKAGGKAAGSAGKPPKDKAKGGPDKAKVPGEGGAPATG